MATGKIFIGSDHAGFELKKELKKFLEEGDHYVEDLGTYKLDRNDDYPDYAAKVCGKVLEEKGRGILICGSGQGMCIAANKFPGIRAALCWDESSAKTAREHLDVNVLCLGSRVVRPEAAKKTVKAWLETPFTCEERHVRRIDKISGIERKHA